MEQAPFSGRTVEEKLQTPLGRFLRTETGSATVLLAATIVALIWANVAPASYQALWGMPLGVRVDQWAMAMTLGGWVNSGLMTFFFFVVGLEARREFDLGELRERRRVALPVAAGVGGMLVAIAIYLAFNGGGPGARGWGVAMSTDTAFALGMLALVGPHFPERLRSFMLTVAVVDDLLSLVVIATGYTSRLEVAPLLIAIGLFAVAVVATRVGVRFGAAFLVLGVGTWIALFASGVDPVVVGLAMGLMTYAAPAARADLERATDLFRLFREQPTSALLRTAQQGLESAVSPNERWQQLFHPWTSYVIVPVFALANAGIPISGAFLAQAYASPITLGIIAGYVVGKPVGILGMSWLVTTVTRGRLRPPVGWAAVAGGGTIAGIGFTVALLIASLAFSGQQLQEAKVGILTAALTAGVVTWLLFRATSLLPRRLKIRALLGQPDLIVDLTEPVDPERDHVRGPEEALVTLVEYGDFECPYCGQAEPVVRELLRDDGDIRYVWRHLPLPDVHPHAQLAAEAAEAAADQGRFWEMHAALFQHQDALRRDDLLRYAQELELDIERFAKMLRKHSTAPRIAADVESADLSGVSGTPTFFVNGLRHHGAYDIDSLSNAVQLARIRAIAG